MQRRFQVRAQSRDGLGSPATPRSGRPLATPPMPSTAGPVPRPSLRLCRDARCPRPALPRVASISQWVGEQLIDQRQDHRHRCVMYRVPDRVRRPEELLRCQALLTAAGTEAVVAPVGVGDTVLLGLHEQRLTLGSHRRPPTSGSGTYPLRDQARALRQGVGARRSFRRSERPRLLGGQ